MTEHLANSIMAIIQFIILQLVLLAACLNKKYEVEFVQSNHR